MKKLLSIILILTLLLSFTPDAFGYDIDRINTLADNVGDFIYESVKKPIVGSVGGEWTVFALARSGMDIPDEYFDNYYKTVEEYVKSKNGIVHSKKHTEYSRLIIALSAIGKNPCNVAGYNLLTALGDYEKTIQQGVNGAIWALIATDCKNYDIPLNPEAKIQATKEMYVNHILKNQKPDGGWALSGDTSDADITGMALQALSKYQNDKLVKSAIEKALGCLSSMQNENGGFSSYETENPESCVQVIVALCELGVSLNDSRFIKNGKSIPDNMLTFSENEKGFKHTHTGDINLMATEQCFYAIVVIKRAEENKNTLYNMSDVSMQHETLSDKSFPKRNPDVCKQQINFLNKTFTDIEAHKEKNAIEALASRGIINGKTKTSFEPDSTMTRAEFATITIKALGLNEAKTVFFDDVTANDWFCGYVGAAYNYGIIKGVSEKFFNPNGKVSREEASVMITRAASLCGVDTETENQEARDTLAQFTDYVTASQWSQSSLAFCFKTKILDDSVMEIKPKKALTRAEIASMIYNMLYLANLL